MGQYIKRTLPVKRGLAGRVARAGPKKACLFPGLENLSMLVPPLRCAGWPDDDCDLRDWRTEKVEQRINKPQGYHTQAVDMQWDCAIYLENCTLNL